MLYINMDSPIKDKLHLFHALKRDIKNGYILKRNFSDNKIVGIYYNDFLIGGALLMGCDKPIYAFCFLIKPEYYTERYCEKLKNSLSELCSDIKVVDVELIGRSVFL